MGGQVLASKYLSDMSSEAQKAHAAWEKKHAVNQPPPPKPHVIDYLKTINEADAPVLYIPRRVHFLKPSCEYRKDLGGYHNTCLT